MNKQRYWSLFFYSAALFNFCMGGPIFFSPSWSHAIAYIGEADAAALRFWGDFGFAVILIGIGYAIVGGDVNKNRGLVWLGVLAKLFDVIALSSRWYAGLAHAIVLIPAAIDLAYAVLFVVFLLRSHVATSANNA